MARRLIVILIFCSALCTTVMAKDDSLNRSDLLQYAKSWYRPGPLKFEKWYPKFAHYYRQSSENNCSLTLRAYRGDISARMEVGKQNYCEEHMNCVMTNLSELLKADAAAATVILGLAPSLLASLGPTVTEISLLSLRRPILAFILSLGCPAIYPSRILVYENPFDLFKPTTGSLSVPKIRHPYGFVLSLLEYIMAAGAAVNILQTAYDMGVRGVLAWSCEYGMFPLLWSASAVPVHMVASFALRVSLSSPKNHEKLKTASNPRTAVKELGKILKQEFELSANGREFTEFLGVRIGPWGIALNFIAGFLGITVLIFGTIVFSGQMFIEASDAAYVLLRYLASALVCRLVLYFELGGIRRITGDRKKHTVKWIVQAEELSTAVESETAYHVIEGVEGRPGAGTVKSTVARTF